MAKLVRQLGTIERQLKKNDILELAFDNAKAVIESGKYDLLKVYIELKRYETYLKGLIEHLKEPALEKANKEGKKSFEYDDARINISKRTKWDFSADAEWADLDEQIRQLTLKRKEREQYLRQNKKVALVDEETGEVHDEFDLPTEIKYGLTVRL
ncbi:MAG: hypothetical protein K9J25_11250 [Bacteroidales bacterium]|nr:hypothetical protein [Bacteroidales bacterium]